MSRGVQFNEDQINEFHEAFLLYDNRGDGKISVNLIGDVMRALGQNPTESEVLQKIIHLKSLKFLSSEGHRKETSTNNSKTLTFYAQIKKLVHEHHRADDRVAFEVFLPMLSAICQRRSTDTTEDFVEGLRHFDKDGNGAISSAELRHLLTTLGEKLNDDEV